MGQRLGLVVLGLMVAAGCDGGGSQARDGGRDATSDARTGGRSGDASSGGAIGTATGGTPGTGGGLGTGGGEGGSMGSGGAGPGSGGSSSSGGATATGGAPATGGRALGGAGEHVSSGGASGIGGIPSTGGRAATGGASASGGAPGTGGAPASGGASASGGAPGSGGANTGGANTGGANTGGANTGGAATGGANTGGASTGGANTGGANTGGAATGGANTGGAATGGRGTGGAGSGGNGGTAGSASLYVVAHPDDDFLFQNPDIETDIRAGKRVRTVYVTSGDANNQDWQDREVGVLEANAAMANDSDPSVNDWSCAMSSAYAGKPARVCTLTAHPLLSVVFLRLHDGQVNQLLTGASVGTSGSTATFNASELTATLSAILAETQPNWVGTLDGSLAHGSDHADHITSAFFAFDVARLDGAVRTPVMYRGYSIWGVGNEPADEPRNLTPAQHDEKARIMGIYQGSPIATDGDYDQWCWRHYPIYPRISANAPLRNGSLCLEPSAASDGAPVHVVACTGAANQNWTAGANSRIVHSGGRCLGLNGATAVIETCSGSARDQIWTLLSDGQIHGTVDQCLTTSGANVSSAVCQADNSQPTSFYFPPSYQTWETL